MYELEIAAVSARNPAGDGQAEARAGGAVAVVLTAAYSVGAEKAIEDLFLRLRRDAAAGVADRDDVVRTVMTRIDAGAADSIGVGGAGGRLLPGRPADVLIVRGDPTREITALWDVLDVYQAGRRIARSVA